MIYRLAILCACLLGLYLGRECVRQNKERKARQQDAIIRHLVEKLR